jgi:zinc ribbon protein
MRVCAQCGRQNLDESAFCGNCAAPLRGQRPANNPEFASSRAASPEPPLPKPEQPIFRTAPGASPGPAPIRKGGIEWIPWNDLTPGQKLGRALAVAIGLLVFYSMAKSVFRTIIPSTPPAATQSSVVQQNATTPLNDADRKDGIVSLCKVFQIYGVPKNDAEATSAADNANELFKLTGGQSVDRSRIILRQLAQEFSSGKLKATDCSAADQPLPTSDGSAGGAVP